MRELNSGPFPYQGNALPLSYIGLKVERRPGSNRRHSAWKADALPTELLPLVVLWGEQDSNLRRYKPTDLQSVLVGRLSISPKIRADGGTRTHDLLITNQLLCQLSYIGDFREGKCI